ncbi:hypothetical protein HMPREF0491_00704 [Lachnospiraceae oral taxon 107 str. F0167]|jgi:putative membrane protein|uniref:HdeD family acid-resistance protein n=1 Tax=Lachnoanaerobaculum sp. Marseille-Q4761 TaxID=2819511 RepID=UPI0002082F7B|nr:DUF308 domain-containing protein [Lachnoanaerobaculum sp. Marseille-Q4761]EGG89574.1 hypothetical protein HMPREF0491_00704 [Lachnospiraceae oral taxon 107 str. F0167]MBO1871759.1 DUF308 domain-containing protein [Lachnoanaerobaculum sp. Marseille-Q4761]RKW38365.1 MAG: hypothetical protein D8H95_40865 [Lachnospiraceae bacterium]
MNSISKIKYFSLLSGIVFLIAGIYMIINPLFIAYTMNIIFCVLLLIEGVSQISAYLSEKREGRSNWRLIEGIVSIIIGIYFLAGDSLGFPIAIIVAVGIWLLLIGISKLLMGMRVIKFERNIGQRLIIIAVIQILFGITVIINPVFVASYISLLIAISLIVQAVVAIFRFFRLNRMERKLK